MPGTMCLYITCDNNVYRIPVPNKCYKKITSLSNQEVLFVLLYYATLNRKPFNLELVNFQRLSLDSKGGYEHTKEEMNNSAYNYLNFSLTSAEELSKREFIHIPKSIPVPTSREKGILYNYIKNNYPMLWDEFPSKIEDYIFHCSEVDSSLKKLVLKANKIKNKKSIK